MWYPTKQRIEEIQGALRSLEENVELADGDPVDLLTRISSHVGLLARAGAPGHILRDLLWIGSQFRIHHRVNPHVKKYGGRAMLWLALRVGEGWRPGECEIQDLRWVTSSTVRLLIAELGVNSERVFMAPAEQKRVDEEWLSLIPEGPGADDALVKAVNPYMESFKNLSSSSYLPFIGEKIERLLSAAQQQAEDSVWAVGALKYLVRHKDAVPDTLGYLGLLDDLYVLEQAHEIVENRSSWLPLLDRFLDRWPQLEKTVFSDEGVETRLSAYVETVLGAILDGFSSGQERNTVVLPDPGPCALLAAFFAVVTSIRDQSDDGRRAIDRLSPGDPVMLGDSASIFRGIHDGTEAVDGCTRHWIRLRDGARIGLPDETAGLLRPSTPHRVLSTARKYYAWKQNHTPSPLLHLIGRDLDPNLMRPEVLLVTQRKRLEAYTTFLKPLGSTIQSLVGIRYVARTGRIQDLPGTLLKTPLLWCCSEPAVASELIRGQSSGGEFRPRLLVVDGAFMMEGGILTALGNQATPRPMVVAGLHEREDCQRLEREGFENLLLRQEDVDPSGWHARDCRTGARRRLSEYMENQARTPRTVVTLHEVKEERFESLYGDLQALRESLRSLEDPGLERIAILGSVALRRMLAVVMEPDEIEVGEIAAHLRGFKTACSLMRSFNEHAARLHTTAKLLLEDGIDPVRARKIRDVILSSHAKDAAVLCPGGPAAARCAAKMAQDPVLRGVRWVSMEGLKDGPPVSTLVVAGWIDRTVMRELDGTGIASHQHLVLFPFERYWLANLRGHASVWVRKLTSGVRERWESYRNTYRISGGPPVRVIHEQPVLLPVEEEVKTPSEWVDARMVEEIRRMPSPGCGTAATSSARLVLFEEPGWFIRLPPGGQVICVSGILDMPGMTEGVGQGGSGPNAEALMSRLLKDVSPGDILAFPGDGQGDLLDVMADSLIKNSGVVRATAGLWRTALVRFAESNRMDAAGVQTILERAGLRRVVATVRGWLQASAVLAPMGWRQEVETIAQATGDRELLARLDEVKTSIDLVYRARREAADRLLQQLATGRADFEKGELSVSMEGGEVRYRLLRVKCVDPPMETPQSEIGYLRCRLTVSDEAGLEAGGATS